MVKYSDMTDDQLVEECKEGNDLAWSELMKRYLSVLDSCAGEFFGAGYSEIDDLISDGIFFGLLNAVKHFDGEKASFATYARRCIRNAMLNTLEQKNAKKRIPRKAVTQLDESIIVRESSDPQQQLEISAQLEEIGEIISKQLTEKEKQAFVMRLKGYGYADIARKLSVTLKAAETAVSRANSKIRASLK